MPKSSLEYWKAREEAQRQNNITEEVEYSRRIEKIFQRMYRAIQSDINDFYVKYANSEGITLAEAKKRVSQLDIEEYAAKAKQYVEQAAKDRAANHGKTDRTAAYFSDKANAEMRLYNATMKINRLELLKAHIGLEMVDGFDELEEMYGDALSKRTLDEFRRQAGILGETVLNNEKLAHSIVNASFHNAKFSDRIWMAQDLMKYRLNEILTQGLIKGLNPRDLTGRVMPLIKKEIINNKRAAAERLLRTELCRVQIDAQMKSYQKNGYNQYIFLAEPTACSHCRALDNKVFPVAKMSIGENAPPIHPNCRCSTASYSESDVEYEKWFKETTGEHSAQWDLEQGMAPKEVYDSQKQYQERVRDKGYDINRWYQVRSLVKGKNIVAIDAESNAKLPIKPKTLSQFEEHQNEWIDNHYQDLTEVQKEQLSVYLEKLVEKNAFSMRVRSETLQLILEDGRFKNQFETGTSGGMADVIVRDWGTKKLFGSTEKLEPREREKYGYLGPMDFVEDYKTEELTFGDTDSGYGAVIVRFKKDNLIYRTTYTARDSLRVINSDDFIAGQLWDAPSIAGIKTDEAKKMLKNFMLSSEYDMMNPEKIVKGVNSENEYFELQYHGDLLVSDIESVCINNNCTVSDDTIQKLKDSGIEVYKVDGDKTEKL